MHNIFQSLDFTENRYLEILKLARTKFKFRDFNKEPLGTGQIIWRHDVDYSPHRALAMAKMEHSLQLGSSYFIRLRGCDYSVLDTDVKKIIHKIKSLGHSVGLHFEVDEKVTDKSVLEKKLIFDKFLLENIIEMEITSFSFHNPDEIMISMQDLEYGGMLNAYSSHFLDFDNYVSDSNGFWRFKNLTEILLENKNSKLQVLTHPEWWTPEHSSPFEKIKRAHFGRAQNAQQRYIELLKQLGRD